MRMQSFTAFFTDHLSQLEATYRWPRNVPKNRPDAPWQFKTNGAAECIALKHHLTTSWAGANASERNRLGHWIVKDWGGVRANAEDRINDYIANIVAGNVPTSLQGVASYSKILSVVDCTRYAIYDARVAASLNAIQLLYAAPGSTRHYFPHVPSRNNTIRRFTEWFAGQAAKVNWTPVPRATAYADYCQLLYNLKAHFSGYEIYHLEMTLFSQAPALCERAMADSVKTEVWSLNPTFTNVNKVS